MNHTKPNFFIVGAPKCGTTAWVEYLNSHPDICFSTKKEPHYFNTDFPGFRWASSIDEYLAYFSDCDGAKIVGEASVQYLYSEEAAKNISEFSPHAKILIFLRCPGAFIRSYHNQLLLNVDEDEVDLGKAWELSGKRIGRTLPKTCREVKFLDYKKVGLFSEQVERYLNFFPGNQIKVVLYEEWTSSPRKVYLDILNFLGLEDDGRKEFSQVHGAKQVVNYRLHQLAQRPPSSLRWLVSAIRSIPRMKDFSPVELIKNINIRDGYKNKKNEKLEKEINQFFINDQIKLHRILDKLSQEHC